MKINLVMIVKNEERSLEQCLEQARGLVDEIVIADTGSTDRSVEIARKYGAKVWEYEWKDDFAAARNFALRHSDAEWNLILDADEYLLPCSRGKLERQIYDYSARYGGRWIGSLLRRDFWKEEERKESSLTYLPRLLPRGACYFGIIHEQPEETGPFLKLPLEAEHDGYLYTDKSRRNLEYLKKAVRYYPEDMYYRFQMAVTLRNANMSQESLFWFREFYNNASRKSGYWSEGVVSYLYALLESGTQSGLSEAFAVVKREQPYMQDQADFWFVCGLFYMKLVLSDVSLYIEFLPRIEDSFLECLRIGERPGGVTGTGSFKAAYNLALWYEVSGQTEKAVKYYKDAAASFEPAGERLNKLIF